MHQRVGQQVIVGRDFLAAEVAGLPEVLADVAVPRVKYTKHVAAAVPLARGADLPEIIRRHALEILAARAELRAMKDRLAPAQVFQHLQQGGGGVQAWFHVDDLLGKAQDNAVSHGFGVIALHNARSVLRPYDVALAFFGKVLMQRAGCTGFSMLIVALSLGVGGNACAASLQKPQLDALIAAEQSKSSADLNSFLDAAAKADPQVAGSVTAYRNKAPLGGDDIINIGRLLGVYNRLHNQRAVISTIERMVALPTVHDDKVPQQDNPAILSFGKPVEGMAHDFSLRYRNVDNRVFEVTLPGASPDAFGILTHADVVPARAEERVLGDGTKLDPFKVTRVGNRLYGRGTIDDKGSIAAAPYAMNAVDAITATGSP